MLGDPCEVGAGCKYRREIESATETVTGRARQNQNQVRVGMMNSTRGGSHATASEVRYKHVTKGTTATDRWGQHGAGVKEREKRLTDGDHL